MCGIAGVVAWDERLRVTRETVQKMSARIAHRGPDGEGTWLNYESPPAGQPQVRLAHRRLAIIDPDPRANQPFSDRRGSRQIVFNGEIYNFRELRVELTKLRPAYEWRTNCDTEVLLIAYEQWGESCLEKLNGMFAFAIWDEREHSLFLARDRMGQKPLYYALAPWGASQSVGLSGRAEASATPLGAIAFASELGALAAVPWIDKSVSPDALTDYLCYGYVPSPRTIYRGAVKLLPAHHLTLRANQVELKRYFDPQDNAPFSPNGQESRVDITRRLVRQAVARQLVADVPLGCFLSGGVDSSIVTAAMKSAVSDGQPVMTFSIGFDDPRYDETAYAAEVAKHLGTTHHRFTVRPDAASDLPKLAEVFGEPFGDSSALPTHYLSRETRQHVKVALSGDGGDELFGGYDRYRAVMLAQRVVMLPAPIRALVGSGATLAKLLPGGVHPKSSLARLHRFGDSLDQPPPLRYASYVRLFDDPTAAQLLKQDLRGHVLASRAYLLDEYARLARSLDPVQTALAVDRMTYLPEDLLTKVDRCSMLHALEVRSPFMDHELVHFASNLSPDELLSGGPKRMLREAFADQLPPEVFRRKKMGFAVPIGEWFRNDLRPMLHDQLFAIDSFASEYFNRSTIETLLDEHHQSRADHSQRLYALLMLELWKRTAGT